MQRKEKKKRGRKRKSRERSISHKALHPPLCGHKQPLYGVRSETASRKIEKKKKNLRREEEGGKEEQNLSSEFLILRNRQRIPEKFHSEPAISGISLAPFPGTPRALAEARVNDLFEFTDCLPSSLLSFEVSRSCFLTARDLSIRPPSHPYYRIHSSTFNSLLFLPPMLVYSPSFRACTTLRSFVDLLLFGGRRENGKV